MGSNPWLRKDPTVYHPQLWPGSTGASLQDIRTHYLRIKNPDIDPSVTAAPWYITDPEPTPSSSLCEICRHINFQWLLRNRTAAIHGPVLLLRDMLSNRSSCSFCRLAIIALCTADGANLRQDDLDDAEIVICCFVTSDKMSSDPASPAMLSVWRRILGVTGGFTGQAGHIQEIGSRQDGCPGRRISSCVDLQLVRNWITTCEELHKKNPEQVRLLGPRFAPSNLQLRVLDVREKCIVNKDYATRYVALSYVWGGVDQKKLLMSNLNHLSTKGAFSSDGLGSQLPRTISDAIQLTANIGERYLWIDALCLIQDGPDFAAEVQSMEVIYGNAAWTLVAGSASHADVPLPRMTKQPKVSTIPQYEELVGNISLAAVLPCLQVVLQASIWNQRAWTYQESVLSTRLLIVTDPQIFFTCRHGCTFYEDTRADDTVPSSIDRAGQVFGAALGHTTNFEVYTDAVKEYTNRQISFHEDGLNAVSGVLASFRSWFRGGVVFGLPETEMDQALLWHPVGDMSRRKDRLGNSLFPSWSWVGWVGQCQYWSGLALSRVKWGIADTTPIAYLTSDELRRPENGEGDWHCHRWTEKFLDDSTELGLQTYDSCWHENETPDVLFLHPVAVESERKRSTILGSLDGRLHFRALVGVLYVTGAHSSDHGANLGVPCTEDHHSICALNVYTAANRVCGTIHVPASLSISLQPPGKHDFIRLSRTHLASDGTRYHEYPPDWDEFETPSNETFGDLLGLDEEDEEDGEYNVENEIGDEDGLMFESEAFFKDVPWCIYNVMLVETTNGISRRVGLGKVHIDAFFQDPRPVWKDIVLS
ncbi:HET-domain-containing protein [Clathrospora elynae]|uniref:HET-domain-containing protein n=1 Tax=Clathrospora elynae TaxID=706981 RepID=A0A6A5T6U9_9PLEO|nr:HET-domain-containing protein [Clathrospora elynae]